jgi:hypothetical protein
MKNRIYIIFSFVSIFILNSCDGNFEVNGTIYHNDGLVSLYLVDENGGAYSNIPYICDSMTIWDTTTFNGEFTFLAPESCKFDLLGLNGTYGDIYDEVVRIVDYRDNGQDIIDYNCQSFGIGSTDYDGSFDYNIDDECTFYL